MIQNSLRISLLIGIVAIVIFIINEFRGRKKKQAYGFEVLPTEMFVMKLVFISLLIGTVSWILAFYQGFSWTLIVVLIVAGIYDFVANKTIIGRHIYAVGGNPEAAELSGISVSKILFLVFGSMGMLAALSGILYASRLKSATTTAGNLFEMDAIAACYIGGVSAAGGVGKIMGAIIGAMVIMSLSNGMQIDGYRYCPPIRGQRFGFDRCCDLRCCHPQPRQIKFLKPISPGPSFLTERGAVFYLGSVPFKCVCQRSFFKSFL